jgi:hypothetical protein
LTPSRFSQLDVRLRSLLLAASPYLTASEQGEVIAFIDVDEYGLALETLAGIAIEERKQLPAEVILAMRAAAARMAIQDRIDWRRLEPDAASSG